MFENKFTTIKFVLLILLGHTDATKWLIDSPGFNNADSWVSEYLPCSLEEVVFPADYAAVLPLPKEVSISGLVFPRDGALLLEQESSILLGGEYKGRSCENGKNRKAYIKPVQVRKWFNPSTWRTTGDIAQNGAVPDMERVPCNNESVVIQRSSGPLSIDLENVPIMRLGQLSLAGSLLSNEYLEHLFNTDLGQLLFKNAASTSVEYYHNDICGCHKDFSSLQEPVCHNILPTCERPHCLVPITPYESCCAICGSMLKFFVDTCDDSNLFKLRQLIGSAINDSGLAGELDYHVNYINTAQYGKYLQAIVIDRSTYSEKSVNFLNSLSSSTNWTKLFATAIPHNMVLQFSGRPYNPNITFGSILLIIFCMLFVSFVALVIFAHYVPDNRYLNRIPQWIHDPRRWRDFVLRSPMVFARFDNARTGGHAAETDMQESIIMGYDAESGEVREERSFDNPMFGENPGKSTAESDSMATTSAAHLEDVTLMDSIDVEDEQELTEIKLDSESDMDSIIK